MDMDEIKATEENDVDNEVVEVGETADVPADEEKEPIPEELGGIDEDIAREIMTEAGYDGNSTDDNGNDNTAEADSDNKQNDVLPNQRIPYKRFKQQVDKNHELEAQIEELKKQLNSAGNNPPQMNVRVSQPPTNNAQQAQQTAQPTTPPIINAEVAEQLKQAIVSEAMRMTGMSQEDVEATEWLDDNDPKLATWKTAQKLAENSVMNKLYAARNQQAEQARRQLAMHNENVLRYNAFAQEQASKPHFSEVQNYAINEYFSKQDKSDQNTIAMAYQRIEQNTASPQDTMIIKNYFIAAENDYLRTHGNSVKANNNTVNKIKQGKAFPRSLNIEGAGSDPGAVTIDTLEHYLDTMPFEKIPKQYQDMLLGKQ